MEEEPGGESPLPAEVLRGLPHLPGAAAATRGRGGAACWPRPPVPRGGARQEPLCGVGGGVAGGARQGLRPHTDAGGRALRQGQGLHSPLPHHARQTALLRPRRLRAVHAGTERWRHGGLCSHGGAAEVLRGAQRGGKNCRDAEWWEASS